MQNEKEHLLIFPTPASATTFLKDKVASDFRELGFWQKAQRIFFQCNLKAKAVISPQENGQLDSWKHTVCPYQVNKEPYHHKNQLNRNRLVPLQRAMCPASQKPRDLTELWSYLQKTWPETLFVLKITNSLIASHARFFEVSYTVNLCPEFACDYSKSSTCTKAKQKNPKGFPHPSHFKMRNTCHVILLFTIVL